jgi:hypothetical protein
MPQMRALQFVLTIIPVQVSQHRYVPHPSKTWCFLGRSFGLFSSEIGHCFDGACN